MSGPGTYIRTPEILTKMRQSHLGVKPSEETRAKLSAVKKGVAHTHGFSRTPTYKSWAMMIQRCCNLNSPVYNRYGGRGIIVCPRWRTSFAAFLEDMGVRPSLELTLDRIDNDGNYEPDNCRWATRSEQVSNQRPRRIRKD